MRLILLALLPAALAACGDSTGYSNEDGTMPAPGPTMEEAAAEAESNAGVSREMPEPMEGSWTTSTDRGDPSVSFGPEGETLLTLICRSGATWISAGACRCRLVSSPAQTADSGTIWARFSVCRMGWRTLA